MGRLDDRVAVVTGAASGIGAATATRLAAEGAKVLLTDIQDEPGQALASKLGPNAAFRHTNVAKESDVAAAVAEAVERWNGLSHAYTVAKHGVVGLTRSSALELAEDNIRVNAVCPGYIATGLAAGRPVSEIDQAELERRLSRARSVNDDAQPMHRMGEPEDIAAAVAWLASDDAAWVTGTTQIVDGGLTVGKPWRDQTPGFTEHRPIRLYAPGTYT
jgi:NAD(P)-dependent dehydrogenase (short-subunit alcohol dehydrogenase family)